MAEAPLGPCGRGRSVGDGVPDRLAGGAEVLPNPNPNPSPSPNPTPNPNPNPNQVQKCFRGKRVHFAGDSTTRDAYTMLLAELKLTELKPNAPRMVRQRETANPNPKP